MNQVMHSVLVGTQLLCIVSVLAGTAFGCIYTHPQQATGYAGERLTYNCAADCGEKFWIINGFFVSKGTYPYQAAITSHDETSTLSVDASAATNNSVVTCRVFTTPNNVESSVIIIVQGTTEGPANLQYHYAENYLNLSWSKPFILPNTELLEYAVNVSTERNSSLFTTTLTSLSLPYSRLDLDPCPLNQTVIISVAGVNQVGLGEPSIIQPIITQPKTENCTQGSPLFPLGAPTNVTAVVGDKSLLISWQPPPNTFPGDILIGYKLRINVTTSQDSLNLTSQSVSTNHTSIAISLSSFGIHRCDGEHYFGISVAAIDLAKREGDFAIITAEITSTNSCRATTEAGSERPHTNTTVRSLITSTSSGVLNSSDADSSIVIIIGVTMTGVVTILLAIAIGVSVTVLLLRRHRLKTSVPPQDTSINENGAYGTSLALKFNGAYGCNSEEELHIYEEIAKLTGPGGYDNIVPPS